MHMTVMFRVLAMYHLPFCRLLRLCMVLCRHFTQFKYFDSYASHKNIREEFAHKLIVQHAPKHTGRIIQKYHH